MKKNLEQTNTYLKGCRQKKRSIKKKNRIVHIHYKLCSTYTLHIEEIDMNKKSNVSIICGSVKLKSKY